MIPDNFFRSINAKKGKRTISLTTQPYCTGMYVTGNDSKVSKYLQFTFSHKDYFKYVNEFIANLKKKKYKISIIEAPFSRFLSEEDINNYIKEK